MTTQQSLTEVRSPAIRPGEPPDDVSSAPESGTVCDFTSGNNPSKGGDSVREMETAEAGAGQPSRRRGEPSDETWSAPESGTVRE